MAIVIADTSPLQYLFQVGQLALLEQLFQAIQVPEAVRDELEVGRRLGFAVPSPAAYSWMAIRASANAPALDRFELGAGEYAALALALASADGLVLMDDAAARAAAKALGVATTGTLGVLLLAKENEILVAVAPVLDALEQRGFRITDAVRARVLQLAGEAP